MKAAVLEVIEFVFDRAEVHRVLNDREVVRDAEFLQIHRLMEDPGLRTLPKGVQEALGCFVPVLINWRILELGWDLEVI